MIGEKYDRLRRSQIVVRLTTIENTLMICKPSSATDVACRKERTELFAALERKDQELLTKWQTATTTKTTASTSR